MKPHPFTPDPDIGPAYDGRLTCAVCRMLGRRDDARHTMPDRPEVADARELAAGEGSRS